MPGYDKATVQNSGLPVAEMAKAFDPKINRGTRTPFMAAVLKMSLARQGKQMSEADQAERVKNLANNFNKYTNGSTDTLSTGLDVTLDDLKTAWTAYTNGTLKIEKAPNSSNGNGGTSEQPKTGTQERREEAAKDVPPVSQNVFASANKVFDGLRTNNEAFPVPTSAQDAYVLLWENLAEPVRQARTSGVLSDAMVNLATNNRKTFAEVLTMLSEDARAEIETNLMEYAPDVFNASLKNTVEDVYHISIGKMHASRLFSAWASQVKEITDYMGRDEGLDWTPTEEQIVEANRNHAVATLRALAVGLRTEVVGANLPITPAAPALARIPFESIIERLPADQLVVVGRAWGSKSAEEQHKFVADLDAEDAIKAADAERAPETKVEDAPKAEAPKPKTSR